MEPLWIHTVVTSTLHALPSKATRCKEVAGYSGPDATAPSIEETIKLAGVEVVKKTLVEVKLKNGKAAITLFVDYAHLHRKLTDVCKSGRLWLLGPDAKHRSPLGTYRNVMGPWSQ